MRKLPFRSPVFALLFAVVTLLAPSSRVSAQTESYPAARQANRIADASQLGGRLQVEGHIPAWIKAKAADMGAVPDSQTLDLVFAISRAPEVQVAFTQLTADQQNPGSPRYHQWLTPAQVGQQYGATQHDLDALTSWLTSQGFSVTAIAPSRTYVQASAPVAVVNTALVTSLHQYTSSAGTLRAPITEPSLPAALSGIVTYIDGLTSIPRVMHNHQLEPVAVPDGNAYKALYTSTSSGNHYLLPGDFNTIYNVKAAAASGYTGAGYTVAIIGGSRLLAADVTNYETLAALPSYQPATVIGASFTDPGYSTDDQTEGMLDFERVYGTAPGAKVDMVIAKNWLNGTVTTNLLLYAINTVNDPVLSLSFGACEALQSTAYVQYEDSFFQQAASQGISVLVSSGDAGAAGCDGLTTANTAYASINDICATSYVTCVGGTEFADFNSPSSYWSSTNSTGGSSALLYIPEGVWNEPSYVSGGVTYYSTSGAGGGFSTTIGKPTFQAGAGVPADGHRDVPDISFSASGHDGYIFCQSASGVTTTRPNGLDCVTSLGVVAGTSAAAPSMAGIAAIIDQRLGGRQGNLNTLLYSIYNRVPAVFHDATPASSGVSNCTTATPSMCNNTVVANPATSTSPGSATPVVVGYPLTTGYDLATGLGSMDVNAFITVAGNGTYFALTPASSVLSVNSGTSGSVTDIITPTSTTGFAGTISYACAVTATTGTATIPPGCTITPSSAVFPATAILTITTIAPHAKSPAAISSLSRFGTGSVAFAGMLLCLLPATRRRRAWRALATVAFLSATLAGLSGCGSGGGAPVQSVPSGGTTTGSYIVTVTGTTTTAGVSPATTSISLTVN